MPEITIPSFVVTGLQVIIAFIGAFFIALWLSLIVWTFRDARRRSRDIFAILLATLMVAIFGPLGLILYFLLRPPVTLAEEYERSLEEEALLQDLEDRPRCPGCSRQVKEEWILCPDCHTTLKNVCGNCRNTLHLAWTVCPYCGAETGAAVGHDHAAPPPGQPVEQVAQTQVETQKMAVIEADPESFEDEPLFEQEPAYSAPTVSQPPIPSPSPTAPTIEQQPIPTPPTTRSDDTRSQYPEADPV